MLSDPHRVAVVFLGLLGLGVASLIAWSIVDGVEARARDRVSVLTEAAGLDWLDPAVDGTVVALHGEAPDEASALAALDLLARAGTWLRPIDRMTVAAPAPGDPSGAMQQETLALTILRDSDSVALVGRGTEAARDMILEATEAREPGLRITDITDTQPGSPPPAWHAIALAASRITAALQHGVIEIGAGRVFVTGLPDGVFGPARIRNAVAALRTAGVVVETSLVQSDITQDDPPVFAATLDDGGGRILLCDAPDAATGATIAAAAVMLLDASNPPCAVRPAMAAEGWSDAAQAGLAALAAMKSGRFELYGGEARLIPDDNSLGTPFETATALLAETIPAGFTLPTKPLGPSRLEEAAPPKAWLRARRRNGMSTLSGTVADQTTRDAVATYAAAVLDIDANAINLDVAGETVADGWLPAAFATLDALAALDRGEAVLREQRVRVWGIALETEAVSRMQRALDTITGEAWQTRSRVTVDLPAAAAARLLPPDACAEALSMTKAQEPVVFAPGEAGLDAASDDLLDRLAETMRRCQPGIIEIGGHTDSQGSEAYNRRLSAARAAAVRDALVTRDIGAVRLIAQGYGADRPIAPNDTEAGRARNRRIAFTAITQADPEDAPPTASAAPPPETSEDTTQTGGDSEPVVDIANAPVAIRPVRRP